MIDGIGGISYDASAGGVAIGDNTRRPRLFKITAGSNPYTASEVVLLETDGSKSNTGIYDVTAAQKVLWEVNGNTSVPVNTIVEATPNAAGLGFYFNWQAASTPSTTNALAWSATSNQLTSTVNSVAASAVVALTSQQSVLTSNVTLNQATTVFQDVMSITLGTGTWLVSYSAFGQLISDTLGDYIATALEFAGTVITGTLGFAVYNQDVTASLVSAGAGYSGVSCNMSILTVASSGSLTLRACRRFLGTVTSSQITAGSSHFAGTRLTAVKIG